MPQVDIDGANSKVATDKLQGQSGTTVTVPTGHVLTVTDAAGLTLNGVVPGAGLTATIATMTGDASDVTLALGATPTGEANVTVHIDGVYQNHDQFSVAGAVLTFTVAPPTGALVESQTWA